MDKKLTLVKVAMLGLISATFAFTNIEIATSKSRSISDIALQVDLGSSANAGICNSRCARRISRIGGRIVKNAWQKRKQQQEQQK